jgi:hypothetical protein
MVFLMFGVSALAHVALEEPPPRYPSDGSSDNKSCPCGVGPNDSLCSDPNELSDPNRSTTVTPYAAGESITVRAHEAVGHSGRWRIAFDPDGADLADFNANILLDVADPAGSEGNVGQGDLWEFPITLPNTPCTNCTLQIIQVMNGNTTDLVPDPTGQSSYYQCADIALTGEPPDTATPPTDTGTPTTTPTPTTPTGTDTADPGPDPDPSDPGAIAGTESGCGCDGSGGVPLAAGWMLLGVPWLRRRATWRTA